MTDINEIIGRAIADLGDLPREQGDWQPDDFSAIGAAVVKALGEAGYTVAKVFTVNGKVFVLDKSDGGIYAVTHQDDAGPECTVCGAAAGLACSRQDCGALIK